jgi:hydrogenase 3 maturation protease
MGEKRTTVWCLGNPLRGDDGAAVRCGEILQEKPVPHLEIVLCEAVPENFAAPLRRNPPDKLVILDACLMGSIPGTIRILEFDCLDGFTETTHGLPLGEIIREVFPPERVFVIGIEPKDTEFSLSLSPEVESGVRDLAEALLDGSWIHIPKLADL